MRRLKVKICGLKTKGAVKAALDAGADFLGFVFFDKSPRNISPANATPLVEHARKLNPEIAICAVLVNPDDLLLKVIKESISPDFIQIHGEVGPTRVLEIKKQGFKIIYAIGISTVADLAQITAFEGIVDIILFDAKPPKGAQNVGGFGETFDWETLIGFSAIKPWFLSGGLNPQNIAAAIAATNPPMVDVSSGVESSAGVKDSALIQSFIKAAKGS